MAVSSPHCVLCGGDALNDYSHDRLRRYVRCRRCHLVFVPDEYHLNTEEEKHRYDQHRNDPHDPRYRAFLSRLMNPLLPKLSPGEHGLDFGSGPGPTLSVMFEERGFPMQCYDLYYAASPSVLGHRYDFVTCSETIEHFRRPQREWRRFMSLLRPGGWLGIMTQFLDGIDSFDNWHYKQDPTHIGFYSKATFRWLAAEYGLDIEFHGHDVVLLHCP